MAETSRILYLDPSTGTHVTPAIAADHGFTHILIPPPWSPSAAGDRYAPAHLDTAPVEEFGQTASLAGIKPLIDIQIDRLAASANPRLGQGLFHRADAHAATDPRLSVDLDALTAIVKNQSTASDLGVFWGDHFTSWGERGIAGFRLLGLDRLEPDLISHFLDSLHRSAAKAELYIWAPGLSREAMIALRGHALAGAFSSFPWWDMRAPWFWAELEILRQAAPVIHALEMPHARKVVLPEPSPATKGTLFKRSAILAATLSQGWMAPADVEDHLLAYSGDLNAVLADGRMSYRSIPTLPAGTAHPVLAILRTDTPDRRQARSGTLALINTDDKHRHCIDKSVLSTALGGRLTTPALMFTNGTGNAPEFFELEAAGSAVLVADETVHVSISASLSEANATRAASSPRLAIEMVEPAVDGGAFPVKTIVGERITVSADIIFDGHEKIAGSLRWRFAGDDAWAETHLLPLGNDRWQAHFIPNRLGLLHYIVTAWRDKWETFRYEIGKKSAAGIDITLETQEGIETIQSYAAGASDEIARSLQQSVVRLKGLAPGDLPAELLSDGLAQLMAAADPRPFQVQTETMPCDVERLEARFASWYEVFPRSLSDDYARHGTFDDVIRHLPRIASMGFDVLYFPPIHPIGRTNRKGRNNTLTPSASDPGSPYAIGSDEGGHDALHPELGTFESFARLIDAAATHGLEIAIDFAVQCAPDHPWLKQHPGWFDWRPDGTIKYAENPPKKYEDIVNVDFYAADSVPDLWLELCRIVLFWARQGVRLFRVDNPHTKPFPFWEWMIREVRARYPDAIFLAEAFTRPKVMYRLAKVGFSQSYTYFTWRNSKTELTAYSTELATKPPRDFFRPHFFVNTPDINPPFLQSSGRAGFLIRAALAATLSGLWGVYNGFELCESDAVPGKEEYIDSEKYQIRQWDWSRPGNIIADITHLNRLRRENLALQSHRTVEFHNAYNDAVIYFEKATNDRSNVILVAVSLDPHQTQHADFEVPLWKWGLRDDGVIEAVDLMLDVHVTWYGKIQRVTLTPDRPYAIWRIHAARALT